MSEDEIIDYIVTAFEDVETVTVSGDTFFFYDSERKFPFVTLVTGDNHDSFSDLSRPSVYRLNIGISKQTFQWLFGTPPPDPEADAAEAGDYDFSALDQLMPHPVYGRMYWVCVLNPSPATFEEQVRPLLSEAYDRDVSRIRRRQPRD